MKIKIRPDDVGAPGKNEWAEMSGWLAELREDDHADPAGDDNGGLASDGRAGPASDRHIEPPSAGNSRAMAAAAPAFSRRPLPAEAGARARVSGPTEIPAGATVRAVIGDQLRMPIMWCEMGSCISWHADPAALGEADIRARAIGAGWRVDALGRMACPRCQQTAASFRATCPVVLWNRATAITMAARATARRGRAPAAQPPERR